MRAPYAASQMRMRSMIRRRALVTLGRLFVVAFRFSFCRHLAFGLFFVSIELCRVEEDNRDRFTIVL